ncbi:MAG: DUF4956 domain-containing protein [Emergencia sp.]
MIEKLFSGLFDTEYTSVISPVEFLICVCFALVSGLILAGCYIYHTRYTKSFVATLAMLPAVVCVIIMMVNGNVGTGVAVAGAFSLVRFRSVPGSAKEIGAIFMAMATGLLCGMGYVGYGVMCSIILGGISILYNQLDFGERNHIKLYKTLRITIPEDLDYTNVFYPILSDYAADYELTQVKSTNMGSLFRLTYNLKLKDADREKEMIDKLRCRNGNLEITVSNQQTTTGEL